MIKRIQQIAEQEQYVPKSLANNVVKINCETPETYKKMVREFEAQQNYHHTYQLKDERAFRIVIRYLHHSTNIEHIKQELAELGQRVRNINILHKSTKESLN
jgi:3-methyladenine DNA glycosylase AlkC